MKTETKLNFFLIFTFLVSVYLVPIFFYGINDTEGYGHGIFSTKLIFDDLRYLYSSYIDNIGIGVDFPIDKFIAHPSSIFLYNIKLYFLSYCFINLFIQCFFIKRIIKLFDLSLPDFFIVFFTIFSNVNANYIYSDDWPTIFYAHSLFVPGLFYLLKFLKFNDRKSLIKFSFFNLLLINYGALGTSWFLLVFFFFIFILLVRRKHFFNPMLYFSIIFLIIGSLDIFFSIYEHLKSIRTSYQSIETIETKSLILKVILKLFFTFFMMTLIILIFFKSKFIKYLNKIINLGFSLFFFIVIFLSITITTFLYLNYNSSTIIANLNNIPFFFIIGNVLHSFSFNEIFFNQPVNRFFFNGIEFLLIIYFYTNFFHNNSTSKMSNEFLLFFLSFNILVFFVPFDILRIFKLESAIKTQYLIFAIISLSFFWNRIKKNKILLVLLILSPILLFLNNIKQIKSDENNYFLNKKINPQLVSSFQKIKKNNLQRVIFSKNLHDMMRYDLRNDGIYSSKDFLNFNLVPVNYWCKLCTSQFYFENYSLSFHGGFNPSIKDLNNKLLYQFLDIKYLVLLKSEVERINLDFFNKILEFKSNSGKIITILKVKNNNPLSFVGNKNEIKNCLYLECFLNSKNFKENKNIHIERKDLNIYLIKNKSDNSIKYIFPFNNSKNKWVSSNNNGDYFIGFHVINLKSNENVEITYNDDINQKLRKFSHLIIIFIFILLISFEVNYFYKKKIIN